MRSKWCSLSKAGSNTDSDDIASPMVPMEFLLDELQIRVKKLERWNRWHVLNNVISYLLIWSGCFSPIDSFLEVEQGNIILLQIFVLWFLSIQVLWTFFMSAFVGYVLYQRKRHSAWWFSSMFSNLFLKFSFHQKKRKFTVVVKTFPSPDLFPCLNHNFRGHCYMIDIKSLM